MPDQNLSNALKAVSLVPRNTRQLFSTMLEDHFKQHIHQQKSTKCEKHGTK